MIQKIEFFCNHRGENLSFLHLFDIFQSTSPSSPLGISYLYRNSEEDASQTSTAEDPIITAFLFLYQVTGRLTEFKKVL
jgi:hypothetical protein